ncbi:MAG: type II toxin-antitoxin system HicA family toxin [Hyphomicrobiales bacterium]|nr:type II toxin-antitoxin system HicA family toxin [Hyphomicrobiales bacterium]
MTARLPALSPRKVIKALERGGFVVHHVTGSHHIMRHADGMRRVTVPFHNRDLKTGALHRIVKDAGFTIEEFIQLL